MAFENSYILYKKLLSKPTIRLALLLRYLGNLQRDLRDYPKAKAWLEESRAIYEKIQGKNTIETAWILWDLGKVSLLEGSAKMAESYMRKALEIFQNNAHPHASFILKDLAQVKKSK